MEKGKNTYTYFIVEEKEIETGNKIAYPLKVNNCINLYKFFRAGKGNEIISITAFNTWKKAQETAHIWNECAKQNGNYMFG